MDVFDDLEEQMSGIPTDSIQSLSDDIEKLKKVGLWLQFSIQKSDRQGADKYRNMALVIVKDLKDHLESDRKTKESELMVNLAMRDLKPILDSYKNFLSSSLIPPPSPCLSPMSSPCPSPSPGPPSSPSPLRNITRSITDIEQPRRSPSSRLTPPPSRCPPSPLSQSSNIPLLTESEGGGGGWRRDEGGVGPRVRPRSPSTPNNVVTPSSARYRSPPPSPSRSRSPPTSARSPLGSGPALPSAFPPSPKSSSSSSSFRSPTLASSSGFTPTYGVRPHSSLSPSFGPSLSPLSSSSPSLPSTPCTPPTPSALPPPGGGGAGASSEGMELSFPSSSPPRPMKVVRGAGEEPLKKGIPASSKFTKARPESLMSVRSDSPKFLRTHSRGSSVGKGEEGEGESDEEEARELRYFRALYPHIAHKKEWLAFDAEDIIEVIQDDYASPRPGWGYGSASSSSKRGYFPLDYTEELDSGFQTTTSRKKIPTVKHEEEKETKETVVAFPSSPPAFTKMEEDEVKKVKQQNSLKDSYHPPKEGEITKRQKMGITMDKRASVAIGLDVLLKMDALPESKKAIPRILLYNDKTIKTHALPTTKPANHKEKKQRKAEIVTFVRAICVSDANYTKVDFRGNKVPYSQLKKLFAAVRTNKTLIILGLGDTGMIGSHLQLFEVSLWANRTLRELDISDNGFGEKEAKLMETVIQKCYGVVCLKFFSDKELARNPSLVSVMQNIDWYIQSNIGFNEFLAKRSTELRLCGRAINSCLGWETFKKTSLLNASYNYIKEINAKLGSHLPLLTEVNFSHNDISHIPYSFGRLKKLVKLDLSFNALRELPSSLDQCESLEVFNLEHNKLKFFPRSILKMSALTDLNVKNNKFKIPLDADTQETLIDFLLKRHCRD